MKLLKPSKIPKAIRNESTGSAHGKLWVDNYAWLRAENWQEAIEEPEKLPSEIADYLHAENAFYNEATAELVPLQLSLVEEMKGRMAGDDDSVPQRDGIYRYSERYVENAEHEIYIRTDLNGDNEEIIFDVNSEAEQYEYFELGQIEHSYDHQRLLWTSDTSGSEYYSLYIRDLSTGLDLDEVIDKVEMAVWANNQTLFYTRIDESHRALSVFIHTIGSSVADDTLVYEEKDNRFSCGVYVSQSADYVFISSSTNDQDEVWFIPTRDLKQSPTLIQARADGLEYSVDHRDDSFVICTNADEAADFKIVQAPVHSPSIGNWVDFVPYSPSTMIEDVVLFRNWTVVLETVNALPQIFYMGMDGVKRHVGFSEEAYSLDIIAGYEFDTDSMLFEYSSPTTPTQTFELNLRTGKKRLLKQEHIPSGHNADDYVARRLLVSSHDGAQVPVTLLYRKDTPIDGTAATLLYGYGAYGASSEAEFSHKRLSLVDRGFIYATAHVRGGQEKGRAWYDAAKYELKPNSFHDFIAVGEALIKQGYTDANKLVSMGGSAGGLLVAASLNMKPSLFVGVIAHVPFVDVLNTMLDDSLPLTPSEWNQWGNPITSEAAFEAISNYSPYENVRPTNYPPVYVTAGVSDPRVTYWEPAKWVANLRHTKTDDNCVLLKTNMQSGHFGQTGRYAELDDAARAYAFAIAVTSS